MEELILQEAQRILHTNSMGKFKPRIPKNYSQSRKNFLLEKARVEKHFPFFNCSIRGNLIVCNGTIQPIDECDEYKVQIRYRENTNPRVFIKKPKIKPSTEYHMYPDGALCLYDHREEPWTNKMRIHETIIPWVAEWLIYYELWLLSGLWHGKSASHGNGTKVTEAIWNV